MSILRINCSPRGEKSESQRLSQVIVDTLLQVDKNIPTTITEINAFELPHIDSNYAVALSNPEEPSGEEAKRGSLHQSSQLIQALIDAKYVVIATPMHNFTISSALKAWIDHVVRVRITFRITSEGKIGTLSDRPVFVAVASGGRFSGENPGQPDFLTPYLKTALKTIGLNHIQFFSVEGTVQEEAALKDIRERTAAEISRYFSQYRLPEHILAQEKPAALLPHQ